jgi:hypothetical protein
MPAPDQRAVQRALRERVERECAEQGVPLTVEDPPLLRKVADLLRLPGRPRSPKEAPKD